MVCDRTVAVATASGALADAVAAKAADALTSAGAARTASVTRLGAGGVWWPVSPTSAAAAALAAARRDVAQAGVAVDINLLTEAQASLKRALIADMDSTIITVECIDEIAAAHGVGEEVARITERAMRGELDFESALRARVALLKGAPVSLLEDVFRERVKLSPGAEVFVRTMGAEGARAALVSGGFTFFTQRVAALCGFHQHQANRLLTAGDGVAAVLTGAPGAPILGREAKREAMDHMLSDIGAARADALAIGDGANDLAIVEAAGLGVAFRAKPALAEAADARLDVSDLTAALYLQRLPESAFVAPRAA